MKTTIKTKDQLQIIGKQQYLNQATNEVEEFTVVKKKVNADFNFHKVWLSDLMNVLSVFGGKKINVVNHILGNLNSDNYYMGTIRGTAKELDISDKTVRETFKQLQDADFMKMKLAGVYQVNPDILVKGNSGKRQNLLIQYESEELYRKNNQGQYKTDLTYDEKQFKQIENQRENDLLYRIKELEEQIEFLTSIDKLKEARELEIN